MSPAKAAPDVLRETRAQENGFTRTPPIPHVPETKVQGHEFLYGTLVRETQSRRKGVLGPHTRNLPNLCLSRLDRENSVRPWLEPVQVLNYPAQPTLLATRKLRTARRKPRAVLTQAAKAADEAFSRELVLVLK